ncbi:4-hydroxy-tetrahydrodipicolinate reductase [Armatimonas rosea]|uniref:4-hydroxy-tetrahydrodipicolinate reductase n=1 Tax=Armatimonas rosea TaxID=685828 RepID=A0A7W9SKX7_ARMRO|nr:4-hydroxy-tetrahydrodipicolinate reductase [Armatimonas rosea]MBB6048485.1 4-hydroxy-tetrahydrodipicolinate reductase [Armatimonas rosea]
MIKVAVTGALGRMGSEVVRAVQAAEGMEIVAQIELGDNLADELKYSDAQVMVDFTIPASALANIRTALASKVIPIVGTSGLSPADLDEIRGLCETHQTACLIAPNFAIGALLMMQFAAQAAKYLPDVEIIELHHEKKVDAPSGTAVKTAQMIAAARTGTPIPRPETAFESHAGATGAEVDGVPVHSVRLPGFVASQEIIFGAQGQRLSLRHDSLDRTSFMPGVVLAIQKSASLKGLTYGLENLL